MTASIRRATRGDAAAVGRLYVALKHHHRALQTASPRYQVPDARWMELAAANLADARVTILVADISGQVRGFVKLSYQDKPWGLACEIDTLVVDAGFRGRGIGRDLMAAAEKEAIANGAAGLRVEVLIDNSRGRSFYERLGYEGFAVRYGKPLP